MKINSFKSIFITKIHAHPSKITHTYQNHYTPMTKHPYFLHTLSTTVHTKNEAQPCNKSFIISSHHFIQSQYQTITPRSSHMNSLSKYAPIKAHIKLHSNTHFFMKNKASSTITFLFPVKAYQKQKTPYSPSISQTNKITHTCTMRITSTQVGIHHIKIQLIRLKEIKQHI